MSSSSMIEVGLLKGMIDGCVVSIAVSPFIWLARDVFEVKLVRQAFLLILPNFLLYVGIL